MSIIQAYKSEADGRLFESKVAYQIHIRKLAATRRKLKKKEEVENTRQAVIRQMRAECGSFDELEDFLRARWREMVVDGSKLMKIGFSEMRWRDSVSNTHDCPRGGVTNFWSKEELPRGYPGWQGRIYIVIASEDVFGSREMKQLGIYTGTGGGGSYDVRLFADDFPGMTKEIMWKKLAS